MKHLSRISGLLFISALLTCCEGNEHKISVKDSDDTYEFFAKFDKSKTQQVQDFINAEVAPTSSFSGDNVDITTTLDDHTKFKLEESPGRVRIELDKGDNSEASYRRIKKMCEGIKKELGEL
ncbi:hypothetical protein [Spirosoma litoris]